MIDREYGEMRLVCDECGDWRQDTYEQHEFHQMIRDAREDGWTVRSGRGEWIHNCPKCSMEFDV